MPRLPITAMLCLLWVVITAAPIAAQEDPRPAITTQTADELIEIRRLPYTVYDFAWSPTQGWLALLGEPNEILIYDVEGDRVAVSIPIDAGHMFDAVAYAPNAQGIYAVETIGGDGDNRALWYWDIASQEVWSIHPFRYEQSLVQPLQISPTGGLAFAGGNYLPGVLLSTSNDSSRVVQFGDFPIPYQNISPDFRRIVSVQQGWVAIYSLEAARHEHTLHYAGDVLPAAPHRLYFNSFVDVAISPDSTTLVVTGGLYDNADPDLTTYPFGQIYNLATGERVRVLQGVYHWIEKPAFNPDGSLIAAYACPKTAQVPDGFGGYSVTCPALGIYLWETNTGRQVGIIPLEDYYRPINRIGFSPDGKWLAVQDTNILTIYGVREPIDRAEFSQRPLSGCEVLSEDGSLINQRAAADPAAEVVAQLQPDEIATAIAQALGPDGEIWWQLANGAWVRSDVVVEAGPCATLTGVAMPEVAVCNPELPTRLEIGGAARVTFTDGTPLNLRDEAGDGDSIGQLPEGTTLTVLSGPTCLENLAWWQVQVADGRIGWVAEGVDGMYYVESQ